MYSHGSSARVGVGRRGPGGRPYRPPKQRDPSKLVPPPLKACNCMVQLDVPEYSRVAQSEGGRPPRRLHVCFEGSNLDERRKSLRKTEDELRSGFGVHLVVPGRNQTGPLAVVGKSHRETLPATEHLVRRLVLDRTADSREATQDSFLTGRILRNVKDPNDVVLTGRFLQHKNVDHRVTPNHSHDTNGVGDGSSIRLQPYWLFESDSWNVMVCPLTIPPMPEKQCGESSVPSSTTPSSSVERDCTPKNPPDAVAGALQIAVDNLRFRLGNAAFSGLDVFFYPTRSVPEAVTGTGPPFAFAAGEPSCVTVLHQEIQQTQVFL